eukprot:SAG31_NODE_3200_length_4562_cov_7.550955_4_plen_734_part_00
MPISMCLETIPSAMHVGFFDRHRNSIEDRVYQESTHAEISEVASALEKQVVKLGDQATQLDSKLARAEQAAVQSEEKLQLELDRNVADLKEFASTLNTATETKNTEQLSDFRAEFSSEIASASRALETSITTLDSSVRLRLTQVDAQLKENEDMLKSTAARLLTTLDEATGRLSDGMDGKIITLKKWIDKVQSELDTIVQQIETDKRDMKTSLSLVDEQFAENATQLRTLSARVDADIVKGMQMLQTQLSTQESKMAGLIAQEHELISDLQTDLIAGITGLQNNMSDNKSQFTKDVTRIHSEINGLIENVDAKFNDEITHHSEMLKALCLEVAKDTDNKVGAVGDRLTTSISDIKKDILDLHSRADSLVDDHSTSVKILHDKFDEHADAHHEKVEETKSHLLIQHEEKHTQLSGRIEALLNQHDDHKNEVRDAVDQHKRSWEESHAKITAQHGSRVDALEAALHGKVESHYRSFEDRLQDHGTTAGNLRTDVEAVMRSVDQLRAAMNERWTKAEASIERSTDTKLKPIQGLIAESKSELSQLRQELHRAEDTFDEKLKDVKDTTKVQIRDETEMWKKHLDAAGTKQTTQTANLREKLLAEITSVSRALQSTSAEQQNINDTQRRKLDMLEGVDHRLDQKLAELATVNATMASAMSELKRERDADKAATDKQLQDMVLHVDQKQIAVVASCKNEVAERFNGVQQQLVTSSDDLRKKHEALKVRHTCMLCSCHRS